MHRGSTATGQGVDWVVFCSQLCKVSFAEHGLDVLCCARLMSVCENCDSGRGGAGALEVHRGGP